MINFQTKVGKNRIWRGYFFRRTNPPLPWRVFHTSQTPRRFAPQNLTPRNATGATASSAVRFFTSLFTISTLWRSAVTSRDGCRGMYRPEVSPTFPDRRQIRKRAGDATTWPDPDYLRFAGSRSRLPPEKESSRVIGAVELQQWLNHHLCQQQLKGLG